MTTILHADLIRAVLDGKTVQWALKDRSDFRDFDTPLQAIAGLVNGQEFYEFRIKPDPIEQWFPLRKGSRMFGEAAGSRSEALSDYGRDGTERLMHVVLDPNTLKVISAETEAP